MATTTPQSAQTSILFEFHCGNDRIKLVTGHHNIPTSFIGSILQKKRLQTLINDIVDSYEDPGFLLQHSNQSCHICGKPSVGTNVEPTDSYSNLQDPSNPRIEYIAIGYCGNPKCMLDIKEEIYHENLKEEAREWEAAHPEEDERKPGKCGVCEKVEGTKFCNKCKVTAYCGKEHQKGDWKVHKKVCAKLAQAEARGELGGGNEMSLERMRTRTVDERSGS